MRHYRVYLLRPDGGIFKAKDVDCRSDDEAVALAAGLQERGCAMEVWQRARKVGSLPEADRRNYGLSNPC